MSLSNSNPTNCEKETKGNTDERPNHINNATLLDFVLDGQLCNTVNCSKCSYQSVMYEPFLDLSFSIPSKLESMKVSSPKKKSRHFPKQN